MTFNLPLSRAAPILWAVCTGCPVKPVYAGEIQVRALGLNVAVLDRWSARKSGNAVSYVACPHFLPCRSRFEMTRDGSRYQAAYFDVYLEYLATMGTGPPIPLATGSLFMADQMQRLIRLGGWIGTAEIYRIANHFDEIAESLVVGQMINHDADNPVQCMAVSQTLDDGLQANIRSMLKREASPRHMPAVIPGRFQIFHEPVLANYIELAVRDVIQGARIKNTSFSWPIQKRWKNIKPGQKASAQSVVVLRQPYKGLIGAVVVSTIRLTDAGIVAGLSCLRSAFLTFFNIGTIARREAVSAALRLSSSAISAPFAR